MMTIIQNDKKPDPRFIKGIKFFNEFRFFEAHEELELAWRDEKGSIRNLYRGILQIGVAYYHIQRGNFPGAQKMFDRAQKWLLPYSGKIFGINVSKLKNDAERISMIIQKNPNLEALFLDNSFFPRIETDIQ